MIAGIHGTKLPIEHRKLDLHFRPLSEVSGLEHPAVDGAGISSYVTFEGIEHDI
ncbi:MAG: hypothetical protein NZ992_01085 [Candidatus Korarchaeum sp.]|nr:hypothetical protein [Candidatus Korarchaeum sp.]MDW8035794.1 hypothetical protein [Candidatus Korarchaeum sp.]